jgi:hypothetical protein
MLGLMLQERHLSTLKGPVEFVSIFHTVHIHRHIQCNLLLSKQAFLIRFALSRSGAIVMLMLRTV